mmetsp:Transcript_54108/g.125863  ORF Transcript_54108/g.125863 Transcript_54108/m.125863 type:complete len:230 (-) Transcript_54108:1614-2303(-)
MTYLCSQFPLNDLLRELCRVVHFPNVFLQLGLRLFGPPEPIIQRLLHGLVLIPLILPVSLQHGSVLIPDSVELCLLQQESALTISCFSFQTPVLFTVCLLLRHVRIGLQELRFCGPLLQFLLQAQLFLVLQVLLVLDLVRNLEDGFFTECLLGLLVFLLLPLECSMLLLLFLLGAFTDLGQSLGLLCQFLLFFQLLLQLPFTFLLKLLCFSRLRDQQSLPQFSQRHLLQ